MEIGTKGQFYIIIMVFMISVIVGIAYFTTESQQLEQEAEIEEEPGLQTMLDSYESELMGAVAGGLYGGDPYFYQEMQAALTGQAAQKGYLFESTCDSTTINSYTEKLDCTLSLTIGGDTLTSSFSHTYGVEFGVEFYSDEYYTDRTDYYLPGDTVYYRVTTADDALPIDVVVKYPDGTIKSTQQKTASDFASFGSFAMGEDDPTGMWGFEINDTTNFVAADFYSQVAIVTVTTFDEEWVPQFTFNRGERVRYRVEVDPPANVYVDVTADGQDRDYDWWSDAPAGQHESSFVVSPFESVGALTLTATEDTYSIEGSAEIQILYQAFGAWIPIGLVYTDPNADAFGTACGYDEWYPNDTAEYNLVPFVVEQAGDNVVRVSAGKEVINAPNVYADKIHILASRCDSC